MDRQNSESVWNRRAGVLIDYDPNTLDMNGSPSTLPAWARTRKQSPEFNPYKVQKFHALGHLGSGDYLESPPLQAYEPDENVHHQIIHSSNGDESFNQTGLEFSSGHLSRGHHELRMSQTQNLEGMMPTSLDLQNMSDSGELDEGSYNNTRASDRLLNMDVPSSKFMKAMNFDSQCISPLRESMPHSPVSGIPESTMDLYEQQEAREQARAYEKFKQLREWQMQQQENLVNQQQLQMRMLQGQQERINTMIAKQRKDIWGGTNAQKDRNSNTSMTKTPPKSSTQRIQPTATVHDTRPVPVVHVVELPSTNHRRDSDFELHSDLDSNTESQSTTGEEGVYPLPDTASERSDQSDSIDHRRTPNPIDISDEPLVVLSPILEVTERQSPTPEKSIQNDNDRPIKSGLSGKTKTFEELLEEQLKMDEQASNSMKSPVKPEKRTFLKRGEGSARFGMKSLPKMKKSVSSDQQSTQQQSIKSGSNAPPGPQMPRKVAEPRSPEHQPIPRLQLQKIVTSPAVQKTRVRAQEVLDSMTINNSMDVSFINRMKERAKDEEVELEELEEFEMLEQYADDNASFSSNSSLVLKVLSKDKLKQHSPTLKPKPASKRPNEASIPEYSDSEDESDSDGNSTTDDSSAGEEANDKTLINSDDAEYDTSHDKPMSRKVSTNTARIESHEHQYDSPPSQSDNQYHHHIQPSIGTYATDNNEQRNNSEDENRYREKKNENNNNEYKEQLISSGSENAEDSDSENDKSSHSETEEDENQVRNKTENSSDTSGDQKQLPDGAEMLPGDVSFDDDESWGDLSITRYGGKHDSAHNELDNNTPLKTDGIDQASGIPGTPPTSQLVSKLFPKLKPATKHVTVEQQQTFEETKKVRVDDGIQSKILRDKLAELENEIERFRKENTALTKLRKEREQDLTKLKKEMSEFQKQKEDELKRLEEFKDQETKKLKHEKKVFERYQKTARAMPDKREREEIETLKNQLTDLQEELKRKEIRWTASSTRLRKRVETLEDENKELKEEIKEMEKRRIEIWKGLNDKKTRVPVKTTKTAVQKENLNGHQSNMNGHQSNKQDSSSGEDDIQQNTVIFKPQKLNQQSKSSIITKTTVPREQGSVVLTLPVNQVPQKTAGSKGSPFAAEDTPRKQLTTVATSQSESGESDAIPPAEHSIPRKKAAVRFKIDGSPIDKGEEVQDEIQHIDGKVERIYRNGAREILFSNGTRKEISSDGQSIIVSFFNGDIKQIMPDQRVVYYYSDAQTTHTTYPDGLEIFQFPNNQVEKQYPDGTREIAFPDQTIKYLFPNGSEESIFIDGTVIRVASNGEKTVEFPNGQREIHTEQYKRREYPDGTVKAVYPDGRQETKYSNGRVRVKDKDGNVIVDKRL